MSEGEKRKKKNIALIDTGINDYVAKEDKFQNDKIGINLGINEELKKQKKQKKLKA